MDSLSFVRLAEAQRSLEDDLGAQVASGHGDGGTMGDGRWKARAGRCTVSGGSRELIWTC